MTTAPANRCNCESEYCAAANAHPIADCHKTHGLTLIEIFGQKQTLCTDCLNQTVKRYANDLLAALTVLT